MIDKELAAFLEEGIGIQIGTRSASLEPNGARVVAVRVDDDGTHIVAFVPQPPRHVVVPDLEATGQAALVFARPTDDASCQVKGVFEGVAPPTAPTSVSSRISGDACSNLDEIGTAALDARRLGRLAMRGGSHSRHCALQPDARAQAPVPRSDDARRWKRWRPASRD